MPVFDAEVTKAKVMSDRKSWKMLHLLYNLKPGRSGLSAQQLFDAGIDCHPDCIYPLVRSDLVKVDQTGSYSLTEAATEILQSCVVANRRWAGVDMQVDQPEVFVIMPFSEHWSGTVYEEMIKPAVESAQLRCTRGDTPPRVGDLSQTVWNSLMRAGLVIADVSASNPNVFYEIGLTHGIGKDCFILKQQGATVPADFGGSHYYEYDLANLSQGKESLRMQITEWATSNSVEGVRSIA